MKRFSTCALLLIGSLCACLSAPVAAQPVNCKLNANPSTTKPGGSVQLKGSCNPVINGTTFKWSGPGTAACSKASMTCNVVAPSAPGNYTYTLVATDPVTNKPGSPGSAQVTVLAPPPPPSCALVASPTTPAPNGLVQLQGACLHLPGGSSFAWTGPGTNVCSANSSSCTVHAPLVPGPATYTLTASFQGGATEPASATVTVSGNLMLVLVSGDNQLGNPGQPLANPLVVRLIDATGAPVAGATVSWSASNTGDSLSASAVITDNAGLASIKVTLGSASGNRTVTASAFGSSVVFTIRELTPPTPPTQMLNKPAQQLLTPIARTATTSTKTQLDNIDRHLDQVRESCRSGGGIDLTPDGHVERKLPWDGFITGDFSVGRQTTTSAVTGYKLTTKGLTLGADASCGGAYIVGGGIGYFRSDATLDDGLGTQNAHGVSGSIWGSYIPPVLPGVYFDVIANFGHSDYDSQRNAILSTLPSSSMSNQSAVSAKAGYHYQSERIQADPYVRAEHISARLGGFAGSGGPDAIAVSDSSVRSTLLTVGGLLRYTFDTSMGEVTPFARLELNHQTQDSTGSFTAWLVSAPAEQASGTLPQSDHSFGNYTIGASGIYRKYLEWYLSYGSSFGSDYRVNAVSARVRLAF
jgi:hypothetical protein